MNVEAPDPDPDAAASRIAAAIGEPARARMLYCLGTCYDHIARTLGVAIHDALHFRGWINATAAETGVYDVTPSGELTFGPLGVDVEAARALRRRFAYPCLDWSERRPHLGGALAAAVLKAALRRRWVTRERDSRALEVTSQGRRELGSRLGIEF